MASEMSAAVTAIAEALLIGFLVGAQRESSQGEGHPGVRDFVLISLAGALCGLLGNAWLTAAALISVTALLGVFYLRGRERSGITTEIAAVTAYVLGLLTTTPLSRLAVGVAVVVAAFLEAKRSLHKLVRETITEAEFDDTLRFLAIIFIVYPILPEGRFGPYQFLAPREIWAFVILVSSISYVGYFLEKFLGARRGLKLAAVLGGLASTTAATASFARRSCEQGENHAPYRQAALIANAMQFPRLLLILSVVSPALAQAVWLPLAGMTAAGLLWGLLMDRRGRAEAGALPVAPGNPFRLLPALKFGALFGAILFAGKAALSAFGGGAIYWTSALGGSLDVDAAALSLVDLLLRGAIAAPVGAAAVLLALLANAAVKTAIAFYAGTPSFARSVAGGLLAMLAVGGAFWGLPQLF
jgi:uncharacterized membrane protein (DUF4010 family)